MIDLNEIMSSEATAWILLGIFAILAILLARKD